MNPAPVASHSQSVKSRKTAALKEKKSKDRCAEKKKSKDRCAEKKKSKDRCAERKKSKDRCAERKGSESVTLFAINRKRKEQASKIVNTQIVDNMPVETIKILLCNIPAYICAAMAIWRKINNGEWYAAIIFTILIMTLVAEAVFVSLVLDPATVTPARMIAQANITAFIIPLLYMFHSPEGGQDRINRVTIILLALTLILFIPAFSWEVVPSYAIAKYQEPVDVLGMSIYYKGKFVYHLYWIAIILSLQSIVSLRQLRKLYRSVTEHNAHYSKAAKAIYYWDFSCGFYLSVFFFFPIEFWQQPTMRWAFYIASSIIIAIGSFLVFLGFDLNPVTDKSGKKFSLHDFMIENGDLVKRFRHLIEDEKIYLEHGIQAETVVQRLGTNHVYFNRMMQAQYGCSFPEYIHQARIEYAKQLLNQSNKTLDAVATECGYDKTSTFVSMYKRITGNKIANN